MSARPILFSPPMVRALREGDKTQTRRLLKPQLVCDSHAAWPDSPGADPIIGGDGLHCGVCGAGIRLHHRSKSGVRGIPVPYAAGDMLWVREPWRTDISFDHLSPKRIAQACIDRGYRTAWAPILYDAGGNSPSWGTNGWHELGTRKRPSIHMPRWASRLTLEVTAVKVERLQDISECDAQAEGCDQACIANSLKEAAMHIAARLHNGTPLPSTYRDGYAKLWDELHGAGAWDANPWVVALTFKVHRLNIDTLHKAKAA